MLSFSPYFNLMLSLPLKYHLKLVFNNPLPNNIYLIDDYIVSGSFDDPVEQLLCVLHEIGHTQVIYPTYGLACERMCWLWAFKEIRRLGLAEHVKYSTLKHLLKRIQYEPNGRPRS